MRKRADAPAVRKGPWHTVRARFRNGAASCRRGRDGSAFIIIIIIFFFFFFFFFFFGERKADAPGSSRHYRRESALSRAAQGAGADTPRRGEGGLCEPLACPGQAVFPHPAPCPGKAAQHGKTPRKKPSPIQGKENAGGCLYILVKFLILIYPWPQQLPVAIGGLSLGRDGAFWAGFFSSSAKSLPNSSTSPTGQRPKQKDNMIRGQPQSPPPDVFFRFSAMVNPPSLSSPASACSPARPQCRCGPAGS